MEATQAQRPIYLIWPSDITRQSALYPPLGLAYLHSALKQAGLASTVLDLSFDPQMAALGRLPARRGIYGISFTTSQFREVRQAVEMLRRVDPEGTVVMGGPHATVFPDSAFDELGADVVALGEAEAYVPGLMRALQQGEDLASVPGIAFRRAGQTVKTEHGHFPEDIDAFPMPDQSVFPLEDYFRLKGFRELSMYTSRGCPARCTFCQPTLIDLFGEKTRFHSTRRVVDEMELLTRRHKLDLIVMSDDTFTTHRERVLDVCDELIRRNTPVFWRVQTRVRGIDREIVRQMKRAGCILMAFGVESGSQHILNKIAKGAKVSEIKEAFEVCRLEGVLTHAYLMVGNLGESEESIRLTEELLREIKPFSSNVSLTTPYPGTYLFDRAMEKGLLKHRNWESFDHILSQAMHIELPGVTLEDLNSFKARLIAVQDHHLQRLKDLRNLVADYYFLKRAARMMVVNPTFVLRALRLVGRALVKRGFALTNPKTRANQVHTSTATSIDYQYLAAESPLQMWPGVKFNDGGTPTRG